MFYKDTRLHLDPRKAYNEDYIIGEVIKKGEQLADLILSKALYCKMESPTIDFDKSCLLEFSTGDLAKDNLPILKQLPKDKLINVFKAFKKGFLNKFIEILESFNEQLINYNDNDINISLDGKYEFHFTYENYAFSAKDGVAILPAMHGYIQFRLY